LKIEAPAGDSHLDALRRISRKVEDFIEEQYPI
jgi:hypothetical protein